MDKTSLIIENNELLKRIEELEASIMTANTVMCAQNIVIKKSGKDTLYVATKRIAELEAELDKQINKWTELLEQTEKRAEKAEAGLQHMIKQDAEGPGNLEGYRELGQKLAAMEKRAEKAEAKLKEVLPLLSVYQEAVSQQDDLEEQKAWSATLITERDNYKAERDTALEVCRDFVEVLDKMRPLNIGYGPSLIQMQKVDTAIEQAKKVLGDD